MKKDSIKMLQFAIKHPGWHSYADDMFTKTAAQELLDHALIEINEHQQFRLAQPEEVPPCTKEIPLVCTIKNAVIHDIQVVQPGVSQAFTSNQAEKLFLQTCNNENGGEVVQNEDDESALLDNGYFETGPDSSVCLTWIGINSNEFKKY